MKNLALFSRYRLYGDTFSPASLFTSGVAGAWYDPSDVLLNWRTNLLLQTQTPSNATWSAGGPNVSFISAPSGFSGQGVSISVSDDSGSTTQSVTLAAGTYTVSCYVQSVSNAGPGSVTLMYPGGQFDQVDTTDGAWVRRSKTFTLASSTTGNFGPQVSTSATANGNFYGFQLELGSTATAYQAITTPEQTYLLYDPQPVLYQDSAGTTPVTAVEQPVGLMLDKSQGLVLGSELVTNGDFSSGLTGWTNGSTGTGSATAPSGAAVLVGIDSSNAARISQGNTVVGKTYKVTFDLTMTSGTAVVEIGGTFRLFTTSGSRSYYEVATNTSGYVIRTPGGGGNFTIDNISVKEIAGNHASQATAASRPVLRARYNLLTYSEQFDNAVWTKNGLLAFGSGSVVNATTAPDGTTTADLIVENTTPTTNHQVLFNGISFTAGATTISVYAKAATGTRFLQIYPPFALSGSAGGKFDLQNGTATSVAGTSGCVASISSAGNGWYRCSITLTLTAGSGGVFYNLSTSLSDALNIAYNGDGTSSIYIWGADLRTGSSAGTYQRIAAATDYATAGFAPYLAFDGVDDFLGAAYVQSAYPLTITAGINTDASVSGSVGIVSVAQSDTQYKVLRDMSANGTDANDRNAGNPETADIIVSGSKFALSQFETSLLTHQVNGGTATTAANTNAFGTSANIFVGKVRFAGLFSTAKNYGSVITNTVLTAAEKDSLKNWMAGKMGVTL